MVDTFTPLRDEKLFEPSGKMTIRFAQFLEEMQNMVNATSNLEDINQLLADLSKANAEIHELQKQLDCLSELVE